MDSLITERLRKGMEARRRREAAEARSSPETPAVKIGERAIDGCAKALENSVRASLQTSFESWEVDLLSQVESVVRQTARTKVVPAAPKQRPSPVAPILSKAAEAERDPPQEEPEEPAPTARDRAPPRTTPGIAEDFSAAVEFPAEPLAAAEEDPPAGAPAAAGEQGELGKKLDELIDLVQASMEHDSDAPAKLAPDLSREIAREVAGRLRDALPSLVAAPPARPARAREEAEESAPAEPPRIPIDDIAAMIDHVTRTQR